MRTLILVLISCFLYLIPTSAQNINFSSLPELLEINRENADNTEQLNILGYGLIRDVAWSPDAKIIAVATSTGVIIYNANEFDKVEYYRISVPEPGPMSVAFSPDGQLLGIVSHLDWDGWSQSDFQPRVISIWSFKSQSIVAKWKSALYSPSVRFSPDANRVVVYYENVAQIWDIRNIPNVHSEGETQWTALQARWYLPEHPQLDSINQNNIIAFATNGKYVAETTQDHTTRIWDVSNKTIKYTFPFEADDLLFSPSGDLAALLVAREGYDELTIWDVEHNNELFHDDEALVGWAFNPTKPQFLIADAISKLSVWDKETNAFRIILGYEEQWWHNDVYSVAFNPHNNELAVARMYQVEIWDSLTGHKLRAIDANEDGKYLKQIVYSPDGKLLATAGEDGYVRLWDATTLDPQGVIEHAGDSYDVAFSPDGKLLATYGNTDKSEADVAPTAVYLWRVTDILDNETVSQSKQALARIYTVNAYNVVYNVRFSPNGQTLAITGKGIELWNIDTILNRNPFAQKDYSEEGLINTIETGTGPIAWSPDGKSIAVGKDIDINCSFMLFNLNDNQPMLCMKGHTGLITYLAFNRKGDLIASASSSHGLPDLDSDNTVRIWNTLTGKQLSILNKHYEDVWTVAFNSEGTLLASGSGGCYHCRSEGNSIDGTVRLWGIPKSGQ